AHSYITVCSDSMTTQRTQVSAESQRSVAPCAVVVGDPVPEPRVERGRDHEDLRRLPAVSRSDRVEQPNALDRLVREDQDAALLSLVVFAHRWPFVGLLPERTSRR